MVGFAVTRLRQFLVGRKFNRKIYRKPLRYIFCPNSQLAKEITAWLAKWAITLMAHDNDVKNVAGQEIGHVDAMSCLQFKDDGNDVFATATATFDKPVIDINPLQKKMATDHFNKRIVEKTQTGKWNKCTKVEKEFAKRPMPLDNSKPFDLYWLASVHSCCIAKTGYWKTPWCS